MLAAPDQQVSFTDPDSRSMATSGRGSGMVGYNVQAAVDTTNHLIVAHEVTNVGTDKSHLANMANQAKVALEAENLEAFADRGYFKGEEILACDEAGITVTLPKPQTSEAKSEGRFGKQDFRYVAEEDIYVCPTGEKLTHHFTNEENGLVLHHYWTGVILETAVVLGSNDGIFCRSFGRLVSHLTFMQSPPRYQWHGRRRMEVTDDCDRTGVFARHYHH